ncbi:unnamed protein product [Tilletia controversa]|nr:unnamed protein product [Tilletia caries]CAD6896533.1 unnamed protein product [Tilletia controversa]CAD6917958.1 unnamed protein product [Tilletia caries]CAD6921059.1 unnamed protein product [Tilletia controversa]CAD6928368.1 unnamed protein product [Tilletia controversa]
MPSGAFTPLTTVGSGSGGSESGGFPPRKKVRLHESGHMELGHVEQECGMRRVKFLAQRRPRAGEVMHPPEAEVPSAKSKGKGKQKAVNPPSSSRRGHKDVQVEPPLVLIERDLEKVASADAPPQAQMEVHTLFVRPPASIFEERERERVRAARLKRRKVGAVGKEDEEEDDALTVKGTVRFDSGTAAAAQARGTNHSGSKPKARTQIYGPATSEWTFEYQDGGVPLIPSTTCGASVAAVKKEEDKNGSDAVPIAAKKGGRKRISTALEVSLATGVPLHPWAAPLHTNTALKTEVKNESLPTSLRPSTRTEIDIFGRPCEYPLSTPQQPYMKVLRGQYRGFAAPERAQLDLEKMWRHRVAVWEAERMGQGRYGRRVAPRSAPLYLRRNLALSMRRVIRWDYEDADEDAGGR